VGDPPESIPSWESVFGSQEARANPDVDDTGTKIVYDQSEGADRVIYLGETEGSGSRRLTNGHVDHHPVFSPNGQMIAYARMPDRIIMINLNGTELLEFGSELGQVNITDWSPSGDRLLFDSGGDIYELDLSTNRTWLLAGEPVDQRGAVYSPDGNRIYYISFEAAGVKPEVWMMLADGSNHIQLTFNDQWEGAPSVSPNGKRVAFVLTEQTLSGDRVCVMNLDGSDVRFFTDRSKNVFNVRWLPNGEALMAEVGVQDSSFHDIESVLYPWEDASFPKNDGGTDGSTSGEGLWDMMLGFFSTSVMIAIVMMVVVAVAAVVVMGRRRRARAESAERLIEMTGRSHEVSRPIEIIRVVPEEERFHW
jgi:Tol biopolymer transport system component